MPSQRKHKTKANPLQEWRKLELLVAKIERALDGTDAVIKSPDRLTDTVTGRKREVDVSVRQTIGSKEVVVIFECRKQGRKQNITWLEQIITKTRNLNAAAVVAVSSSGFSASCKALAEKEGIELREIEQISITEIQQWASFKVFSSCIRKFGIKALKIDLPKPYGGLDFDEIMGNKLAEAMRSDSVNTKFLVVDDMPDLVSAGEIVMHSINAGKLPDVEQVKDGFHETRRLDVKPIKDQSWYLKYNNELVPVSEIHLLLVFEYEVKQHAVQDHLVDRYFNKDGTIAHQFELELDSCLGLQRIGAVLDNEGQTKFIFSLDLSGVNLPIKIDE